MKRGTMSQSKWRRLRRWSSAWVVEAKARSSKAFFGKKPARAVPAAPRPRSQRLTNRSGRVKQGGLRRLFRRPVK